MSYENLDSMKTTIVEKAQRRLSNNYPDYEYDEDLLGDYYDDAVSIIMRWRKETNANTILTGRFDTDIIKYIVESIVASGLEGQSYSSANGITKTFISTPESNLKSSIPQRL